MDSDDVDSNDSGDDVEPAQTFESPPRRHASGQTAGLLDSIARVEAALGNFGKKPQDPRQRDDGRAMRHGAFGSATGDRRMFPADLSKGSGKGSASNTPIDTPPQSQSISSDWERFAPPSRDIARAAAYPPARDARALRPGPERFFYDKSSYTGTHAKGGPDAGSRTHVSDLKYHVRGGPSTSGGLRPRKSDIDKRQRSVSPNRSMQQHR